MISTQLSLIQSPEPTYGDSDQRYTPDRYFPAIAHILGGQIGLDPTADPTKRVPALHHITEADNCLTIDWGPFLAVHPTSFLNPPYSDSGLYLNRLAQYLRSGECELAVTLTLQGALCNVSMQPLFQELALATCCPLGRINFLGSGDSNNRDVVWALWGDAQRSGDAIARFCDSLVGLKQVILR